MKKLLLTAALSIAATVAITACAVQEPVDINSMSLEKTSPFETPTPKAYGENAGLYRETQMGMPAMIPHAINNFKITHENNPCIMCHGNQAKIGAAKVKGEATAMPTRLHCLGRVHQLRSVRCRVPRKRHPICHAFSS